MIKLKNVFIQVFNAIKNDKQLLDLLGVTYEGVDKQAFLTDLRRHVIEASKPDGILKEYHTRLCLHENNGLKSGSYNNIAYFTIDIHVSKENNTKDGRLSDISQRIIEIVDTTERKKVGLPPLDVGLYGLNYNSKNMASNQSGNTGWEMYTIVFEYKYL